MWYNFVLFFNRPIAKLCMYTKQVRRRRERQECVQIATKYVWRQASIWGFRLTMCSSYCTVLVPTVHTKLSSTFGGRYTHILRIEKPYVRTTKYLMSPFWRDYPRCGSDRMTQAESVSRAEHQHNLTSHAKWGRNNRFEGFMSRKSEYVVYIERNLFDEWTPSLRERLFPVVHLNVTISDVCYTTYIPVLLIHFFYSPDVSLV